jgi:hypothetical protein
MGNFNDFFDAPKFDFDEERKAFIENLDMLKAMTVQEQTLYKKYKEVNDFYFHSVDKARQVKAKIWTPTDIHNKELTVEEIRALEPRIRVVASTKSTDDTDWNMLRVFSHSMEFDRNPGRFLRFLVYDNVTGKYLGATSLGSDVIVISCRDKWIGWSRDVKIGGKKLANSAIGTCIMATQPFGYNFLGGKLVASLLTTNIVSNAWQSAYDDILVGLTTTSLYGSESMYNSIPFWKKVGSSTGKIGLKPDDAVYARLHSWLKENFADEYAKRFVKEDGTNGPVTGIKQQILTMLFRELEVSASKYKHGFERGVYYAPRYENTREFLRGEITHEALIPLKKLEKDVDSVIDWWKPKAIARYEKLHDEGRIKDNILYYTNLIGLTWEEARERYLVDVGR